MSIVNCFSQVLSNNGAAVNITPGNVVNGGTVENNSGTITTGGNLWLTSNAINTGTFEGNGTYYVAGNWTNDGTFDAGTSTVIFNGGAAQTIGGLTIGNNFNNITIENTLGGVSLLTDQGITGTLTLTTGTFTTTGKVFTLISNVAGTARIAEITGGDITGSVTMQRYVAGNDGWRLLSGTVATNIEDWNGEFAMSGFPGTDQPDYTFTSLWTYNESTLGDKDQGFEEPSNTTNALTAGKGYMAWIGDGLGAPIVKTLALVGAPNKFAQPLSPTYTDDPGQPASQDGWNLVGNPYPSTINWDAAGWTKNASVNSTIYIWRDDLQVFASYTTGGPNPGPNGGVPTIASMQGFWVQTNAAAPVLTAAESVKSATDQPFFKLPPPDEIILKLKITATNGYSDETFIRFMPNATANFEGDKDAYKLFSISTSVLPPQISSIINDSLDLCLNSFPELNENRIIPLRVKTKTPGNMNLQISGTNDIPSGYCILLQDKYNGNITDLKIDTSYGFLLADTTDFPRFELHLLKNDSLSCEEQISILSNENNPLISENNNIYYTLKNGQLAIYFDFPEATNSSINIYNLLGQNIMPEKNCSVYKSSVTIDLSKNAQAVYLLSVSTPDKMIVQKFFLK